MSSSVPVDNLKKDNLLLGEGPIQGLDNTTITAEAKYSIVEAKYLQKLNIYKFRKKLCFRFAL